MADQTTAEYDTGEGGTTLTVRVPVVADTALLKDFYEETQREGRKVKAVEPDPWLDALREAQADLAEGRFTRHLDDDDLTANGFSDD